MDKAKQIALDYKETFATPSGQRVLAHLKELIKPNKSQNPKDGYGRIDISIVMKNEGKRAIWCHIDAMLQKDLSKEIKRKAQR